MARFCSHCGAEIPEWATTCSKCGATVEREEGGCRGDGWGRRMGDRFGRRWDAAVGADGMAGASVPTVSGFFEAESKWQWMKENLLTPHGRINRLVYLKWVIILAVLSSVLTFAIMLLVGLFSAGSAELISRSAEEEASLLVGGFTGGNVLFLALYIALSVPLVVGNIFLSVRRFHDFNITGWAVAGMWAASFIPFIGTVVAFVGGVALFFVPGTRGRNKYGADPLAGRY